jgi:outer membrane protein assembly factor BamB/TolA-binding protein
MRAKLRFLFTGLFLAFFAWVASLGNSGAQGPPVAVGAQPPAKDKKGKEKEKREGLPDEDNVPFTFEYQRDAKNQLIAAREYLEFKEIPWNTVCPLLQNILEAKSDSFFNSFFVVNGQKQINRISVKTEANRIIAAFPKEGLQFYQQAYGATASGLLDDAIKANYDLALLSDLSQRYFHTKAGAEATILLGTLHLERGNYLEAAYAFERVLTRPNVEELITPRTLFKACLAFKRSGDARHVELLKTNLESLQKATAKDGLAIGRKTYSWDQLRDEINRPMELIRATTTVGEWAMRGGNPPRTATIGGGPPFLDPTFRTPMFPFGPNDEEPNTWIRNELDRLYSLARDGNKGAAQGLPLPGFFPVTTPDLVVFRAYNGVYGVATRDQVVNGRVVRAGEIRWVSKTNMGVHQMLTKGDTDDIDMYKNVTDWWATYNQTKVSSILYENPLIGTLAHDGQNVYFVDDVAIPPPPVYSNPEFGIINNQPQYRQSGELADAIRAGRLVAVDLRTGMVKWELGRVKVMPNDDPKLPPPPPLPNKLTEEEGDKTTDAFRLCLDAIFLGAPLPMNGKLYVLIEQAGVMRLLCLDPKNLVAVPGQTRKPALLWTQKLGRPNNNLPQDSIRRYQGATLAAGDGIIICPTNSGAIVAVDTNSRSLLWAYAYRHLDPNARPGQIKYDQQGRPIPPDQLKVDRWRSAGPIIANGRVILTAYDSEYIDCIELRTGKRLWRKSREANDLYVGGVVNDRVVVVGRNQVRGYHLNDVDPNNPQTPRVAFEPVTIPTPTGHGVGGKGVFYVPVRQDNAGRDTVPSAEIWAVNAETGEIKSKTGARKRENENSAQLAKYGLGNLVFQDGMVFAQSAWELACYPQLEQKRAEMDRLLAINPKDPSGLLTRGELLLDEGKIKEAIADFKEAQKNNLPPEKLPTLRDKLYLAYTDLIRNDFKTAESILDEYKALCEIPADPNEAPDEKIRRLDENERRTRLYLYLLARGRESQGKLGEAFDHYVSLANMGEAKNLLEMPDEPNVRMRPDVWARGRIEAMIRRATDPAARQSLEARVNQEWDAVKAGTDLKRLREFVAVFGPYFATGAEAQFLLADKLLETNNEADAREAQTHLAQLRVTAESPTVRARATEALARLMIKNQQMEDAVGLYLQLGKEYPNVVVRDGKTGLQFMTHLLTDKRVSPFLEPSRYPLPSRVKADERRDPVPNQNYGAQFEIEPVGDLFPAYRRYRFVIDQYYSGDGRSWTLRMFDRATGVERAKFPSLAAPQLYTNQGYPAFPRNVQGNGQLVLLQLGSWVYCLDLAERKERWQKNLIGDNMVPTNPGGRSAVEMGPEGDITVKLDDGFIVTFGKSTVLEAGYAALLTRDGLEVVEPMTRRVLWTRRDVKDRTHVYGDARYIVLIENDAQKKPVGARLLRAVDGMPVEGSGDSGRVLATAKTYQIQGRTALLTEGTGEQPRVLRLFDLGTGKDVWRKEYDHRAVPIKSHNPELTGFVKSNGEAEVIEVKTGKTLATLKIDEKNLDTDLKPCVQAQLLNDADRYYLFLDRDPSAGSTNGTVRLPPNNNPLRTTPVNGPLYAFDRATGKRLWNYGNGLFENQLLILEQFNELPVIMANSNIRNQQNQSTLSVVILEKTRGRLIFDRPVVYDGNVFQSLSVDAKNGTMTLNRYNNLRVVVSPDDTHTLAGP